MADRTPDRRPSLLIPPPAPKKRPRLDTAAPDYTRQLLDGAAELPASLATPDPEDDPLPILLDMIADSPFLASPPRHVRATTPSRVQHYSLSQHHGSFITFNPHGGIRVKFDRIRVLRSEGNYGLTFTDLSEDMQNTLRIIDSYACQAAQRAVQATPIHRVFDVLDRNMNFMCALHPHIEMRDSLGAKIDTTHIGAEQLSTLVGRVCTATFMLVTFTWRHQNERSRCTAVTKIKVVRIELEDDM